MTIDTTAHRPPAGAPRMHALRRATGAAVTALALLGLTTACSGPTRPHSAGTTVVVVGNRANMPAPSLVPAAAALLKDSIRSQDDIYVVDVSGAPQIHGPLGTHDDCDSDEACADVWASFQRRAGSALAAVKATSPGADLLTALTITGRQLASVSGPKHVLVVDSGLSTTGSLPLQAPGVLDAPPTTLVSSLKANGSLPNLHGADVLMTGLGSTYAPQVQVPERYRTRLVALWRGVVDASSGRFHEDESQLPATAPAKDLPAVASVPFPKPLVPGDPVPCTLRLRADQIGFVANKATFADPARARSVLAPVADQLRSASSASVRLIGTTAVPELSPNSPSRVSLRRAIAVRRVLITQLHVPASRIRSVDGVGTSFSGFVKDTDKRGRLIEALAIGNRLVIVKLSTCGGTR